MKPHKTLWFCLLSSSLLFSNFAFALNCPNAQTQTEMNQCAFAELNRATTQINQTYYHLRTKLNPVQKQQLKDVQLTWIKFKDLACEFEASGVEGGSVHSMILSACLSKMTQQRNKELEALANCLQGDLSCPAW